MMVTRKECGSTGIGDCCGRQMVDDEEGSYVLFEDYATLRAELAAALAENERLHKHCVECLCDILEYEGCDAEKEMCRALNIHSRFRCNRCGKEFSAIYGLGCRCGGDVIVVSTIEPIEAGKGGE